MPKYHPTLGRHVADEILDLLEVSRFELRSVFQQDGRTHVHVEFLLKRELKENYEGLKKV